MTATNRTRLERFFRESLASYLDHYALQDDQDAALKAVCESIAWACALDEHHMKTSGHAYTRLRDADPDGALMPGIRYARNRALHQFAELVEIVGGIQFPIPLGSPFWEFVWRPVAELPPADPRHENASQRKVYEDHLATNAARFALQAASDWFGRVP